MEEQLLSGGFRSNGSNIAQLPLSHRSTLIGADRALHGGFGNGVGAEVAEAEKDLLRALRFAGLQERDGALQGLHAEIILLAGALHAVEECGEVDKLAP